MAKYSAGGRPKGKTNGKIPWAQIKAKYFTGDVRIKDLAIEYGIHPNSITKRKAAENWDEESARLQMDIAKRINEDAFQEIAVTEKERIKRVNEKHERIADMLVDFTANHIETLRDKGVTWINKATGQPYNPEAIVIGPLDSLAGVANKFVHNVKNAVQLQRVVMRLDHGVADEESDTPLIEFLVKENPNGPDEDTDLLPDAVQAEIPNNVVDINTRKAG